jgi:hypothetical protein
MSSIEDYNRQITKGVPFKVERNETIRGSINWDLVSRLKDYWRMHGYPTDQDYINHVKSLKLQSK